jgi:hypothetical protein
MTFSPFLKRLGATALCKAATSRQPYLPFDDNTSRWPAYGHRPRPRRRWQKRSVWFCHRSRRNCAGDPRSFGDHWRSRSAALISFDMEQARDERDWRQARRAALGPRDDGLRGRCAE